MQIFEIIFLNKNKKNQLIGVEVLLRGVGQNLNKEEGELSACLGTCAF